MAAKRTTALVKNVREAIEAARDDSHLLDGREYDEARWQSALDDVDALAARSSAPRSHATPCSADDADRTLAVSPLTLGELEVFETLAAEGVVAMPRDYMRLVLVVRMQHDALNAADEETMVGTA